MVTYFAWIAGVSHGVVNNNLWLLYQHLKQNTWGLWSRQTLLLEKILLFWYFSSTNKTTPFPNWQSFICLFHHWRRYQEEIQTSIYEISLYSETKSDRKHWNHPHTNNASVGWSFFEKGISKYSAQQRFISQCHDMISFYVSLLLFEFIHLSISFWKGRCSGWGVVEILWFPFL